MAWSVRAFSFQSDLTFGGAMRLLLGGGYGDWYERDSAWYDELATRREQDGVRMNLYRFPDEWIVEMKASGEKADRAGAEAWVMGTLLPALGAREVKGTGPVN